MYVSHLDLVQPANKTVITEINDKKDHETWHPGRDPFDIPHPYIAAFIGSKNSGKSTQIKTLWYWANPKFDIVRLAQLSNRVHEYDWMTEPTLEAVPTIDWFDEQTDDGNGGRHKMLFIMEDLEFDGMEKEERHALSALLRTVCSHMSVTVFIAAQMWSTFDKRFRQQVDLFVYWPTNNVNHNRMVSKQMGGDTEKIRRIMRSRDMRPCAGRPRQSCSIWVDNSGGVQVSPHKYRINGFPIADQSEEELAAA